MRPDPKITKGMKPGSYSKLEDNGMVKENTFVTQTISWLVK